MKFSKQEYSIGIITLCFIIALSVSTIFPSSKTHLVSQPSVNVSPYYININTADVDELTTLEGVGPKLAENIVKQRKRLGGFKNKYQLNTVPGMGDVVFNKIKDHIKV